MKIMDTDKCKAMAQVIFEDIVVKHGEPNTAQKVGELIGAIAIIKQSLERVAKKEFGAEIQILCPHEEIN